MSRVRSYSIAVLGAIAASVIIVKMTGAVPAAQAQVTVGTPGGVIPHHKGTGTVGILQFPQGPLQYYGGPVLRTNETFAIFWDPSNSLSQAYRDLVIRYLQDVAADSGTTNVYSVLDQYYDKTGPIAYASTFAGSAIDTNPYPSGCPTTSEYPVCFNDQQLASELDDFLFANDISRPSNRVFLVITPQGINSCFDSSSFPCASNAFCGYHSAFTGGHGDALYANFPYAARPGCDTGQHPNGSDADPVINVISHEHKETIDDPLGSSAFSLAPPLAWFDPFGGESSDKCAWYFGPTQNNGVGDYNQVLNGHQYLLQTEWSNALAQPQGLGCVGDGADRAPTPAFTATPHGAVVGFDASASADPDPGDSIQEYFWDFGDGTRAPSDSTTSHTYPAAGTYAVVLTVTDSHGAAAYTRQTVTVTEPDPTIPFKAMMTEAIDDRGRILGSGNATRFGGVLERGFGVRFDFSHFPASIGVSSTVFLLDNAGNKVALVHYHVRLTDVADPPQGNDYRLTGSWSIVAGSGPGVLGNAFPGTSQGQFVNAFGSGTITGTCTSSFTSDIATCKNIWTGTIGPP